VLCGVNLAPEIRHPSLGEAAGSFPHGLTGFGRMMSVMHEHAGHRVLGAACTNYLCTCNTMVFTSMIFAPVLAPRVQMVRRRTCAFRSVCEIGQ
jgi:hypothetical protein